jgi:NTP pyrophosphatase (non-canonical NTP hydrolase)
VSTIADAKKTLAACSRAELQDHAFGDAEVYWKKGEEEIAYGYFSRDAREVRFHGGPVFIDGEADELRSVGKLASVERNDAGGERTPRGRGLTLMGMADERTAIELRPVVRWFAEQMELKLREKDGHKPSWDKHEVDSLLFDMSGEVLELAKELEPNAPDAAAVIREAADVASLAMMIADHHREGGPSRDRRHLRPLRVYKSNHDWFVAESEDDAWQMLAEHLCQPVAELVARGERFEIVPDDKLITVICEDHPDGMRPSDSGFNVKKTAAEWVAQEGRGYLCSEDF